MKWIDRLRRCDDLLGEMRTCQIVAATLSNVNDSRGHRPSVLQHGRLADEFDSTKFWWMKKAPRINSRGEYSFAEMGKKAQESNE